MARIIKSSSKNGEVVVKEPSKIKKFIKNIKPKHLIIAWDIIASCLVVTFIVLLAVRFWPSKNEAREANTIEQKVVEYTTSLDENEEALVQEVLVEELEEIDTADVQQCFIYAYNPDVENCIDYWEYDYEEGDFVYEDEDKEVKISTELYETNSKIIIDLIDRLSATKNQDNVWSTRLYIIDITKASNRVEIKNVGGEEVSIDLTKEGISQSLHFVKLRDGNISSESVIGNLVNPKFTNFITDIQASLYKYTYCIHTDPDDIEAYDEYNAAYKDYLPISSKYYNTDVVKAYYDEDNGYKAMYNWYTTDTLTSESYFDPTKSETERVGYKQNADGTIVTEYHYYGVKK